MSRQTLYTIAAFLLILAGLVVVVLYHTAIGAASAAVGATFLAIIRRKR